MTDTDDLVTRQLEELEDAANVFSCKVQKAIKQCSPTLEGKIKSICKILDAQLLLNRRFNKTLKPVE